MGATVAGTGLPTGTHDPGNRNVGVPGRCFLQRMDHSGLGGHQESGWRLFLLNVLPHAFRTAHYVSQLEDILRALRVRQDATARIAAANADQILDAENFVNHAGTWPEDHAAAGDFLQVSAKVLIRDEENLDIGWDAVDDFPSVAAGDDPVAEAFHGGRGVDVGNRLEIASLLAELLLKRLKLTWRATVGQRASGQHVGNEHSLLRIHDLGRLAHEVHAGKNDGGVGDAGGIASQFEAVSGEIRNVLDLAINVEVGEYCGVPLAFQDLDFLHQIQGIFGGCGRFGKLHKTHEKGLQGISGIQAAGDSNENFGAEDSEKTSGSGATRENPWQFLLNTDLSVGV